MALFFGKKDPIERLKTRSWSSDSERDALIDAGLAGSRDQDSVLELLYVDDREVQRAALRRLKALATPHTLDSFIKVSRNKPLGTVQAIAQALSRLLPDEAQGRALGYVDHKDGNVRKIAEAYVLACPPSARMMAIAEQWLDGSDHGRATKLLENIERALKEGSVDPGVVADTMARALDHPSEHVRHIGWRIKASKPRQADIGLFIDAIGRETYTNQKLLADAITQVARRGGAEITDQILPLLGSNSAVLRTTAVNVLKRLSDPDAVIRRFVEASRTMAPIVRERSLQTLGDLGERLIEPLLELMEDRDPEICMLAITMAASLGEDRRMVRPLLRALRAKDWWVQATAAETLGSLGDPAAIEPLKDLLSDSDTVWTAIGALAAIATALQKRGDKGQSAAALNPLMALLKAGQRGGGDAKDPEEAADLRLEIINALRPLASERMQGVMRRVAQHDRDERVRLEALSAATAMAKAMGLELDDEARLRAAIKSDNEGQQAYSGIDTWLALARNKGASDLHIAAGQPVMMRRFGRLIPIEGAGILPPEACARLVRDLLSDEQAAVVTHTGQLNLSYALAGAGRFRANVFADYHGINAVFRVIPETLPTIQSIGLPGHFADVQYWHQGLLLVCGASGSGKTTTLTALINLINETRESHIITIEDPIEYIHTSRRSLVNQRELGHHTRSYARALRGALRQDPDVIVVGEMNDPETVSLAMEASETGHLVIGTLNCTRAEAAVDRVVGSFSQDEQNQVRLALSEALKGIIAQSLLPTVDGTSMAAAFEIIMGTPQVSNIIREGKTTMLQSIMQTGQSQGMQTFDDSLMNLVRSGRVTSAAAARRASDRGLFEEVSEDQPTDTASA